MAKVGNISLHSPLASQLFFCLLSLVLWRKTCFSFPNLALLPLPVFLKPSSSNPSLCPPPHFYLPFPKLLPLDLQTCPNSFQSISELSFQTIFSLVTAICSSLLSLSDFHSVQFSCSVMSDSLQPHGLQHTKLPCPSPTPGAYSNSCP